MKSPTALAALSMVLMVSLARANTLQNEVNVLAAENAIEDKIMKAVGKDMKGQHELAERKEPSRELII